MELVMLLALGQNLCNLRAAQQQRGLKCTCKFNGFNFLSVVAMDHVSVLHIVASLKPT